MRKPRVIQAGATYHVVAKTNRGEFIFESNETKEMFIQVMKEAKRTYNFKIKHYCIMNNHIHLLLEPTGNTNLSGLMQWILGVFARRFNKMIGSFGHVWYDRFKSNIVRTFQQFTNTFEYISNNPVKAGICSSAKNYAYGGLYELSKRRFSIMEPLENW